MVAVVVVVKPVVGMMRGSIGDKKKKKKNEVLKDAD